MYINDMKEGQLVRHVRSKKVYVVVCYFGKLLCQPWDLERGAVKRRPFSDYQFKRVYIPASNLSPFEAH